MDWDDLRLALIVARTGNSSRAAEQLGVARTTITRRLDALEKTSGALLFDRSTWQPTAAGEALLRTAGDLSERIETLRRTLQDDDARVAGVVTVAASELVATFLASRLRDFGERHPDLSLRLRVGAAELDLAAREADIAVRVEPKPATGLVGRRVGWTSLGVYGARALRALDDPPWVSFEVANPGPHARVEASLARRVILRTDSRAAFLAALREGVGVGVLPCVFGDAETKLVRRGPELPDSRIGVWVLTTPALQRVPRIRATSGYLVETLRGGLAEIRAK